MPSSLEIKFIFKYLFIFFAVMTLFNVGSSDLEMDALMTYVGLLSLFVVFTLSLFIFFAVYMIKSQWFLFLDVNGFLQDEFKRFSVSAILTFLLLLPILIVLSIFLVPQLMSLFSLDSELPYYSYLNVAFAVAISTKQLKPVQKPE